MFVVAKALGYKPEGRGFETFQPLSPGVYSASNRKEYRKYLKKNASGE
jgi:hypothetical protein